MIDTPTVDWLALSPTIALLAAAGVALLSALLPAWMRKSVAAAAALVGFVVAAVLAGVLFDESSTSEVLLEGTMVRDQLAAMAQLILGVTGAAVVLASWGEQRRENHAEYYALLATAGAGMVFFVGAEDLMTLFLGLEWFSLCLYILVAIDSERETSLEAGLKYLIVGGFGSAVLLFGSALVYGATSELSFPAIGAADPSSDSFFYAGLAMILAGLAFKVSAAPFHMWTPDVYQGSPTSVTAFMAAATKTAALVVTLRVLVTAFPEQTDVWTIAVAVLAAISLVWGNLGALAQSDVKRLLAYSSISHAGFMLMAIAASSERGGEALLYYLVPYCAMSVGAFAVIAARERELQAPVTLDSLAGMGWERPYHGIALWIFMLGMAGFPLTGGMFGKLFVFSAAYDAGDWWLVLLGVAATAVSLGYYLNVVRRLYMSSGAELRLRPRRRLASARPGAERRHRRRGRRHGRLVLRRAADSRRRLRRCGVSPLLREDSFGAILKDRRGKSSREGAGPLKARLILATVVAGGLALAVGGTMALAGKPAPDTSKYPDLRTVVPTHLNLVNQQQNEYLRFSNGIANTGGGPWAMRPENELGSAPTTTAWQEIRSSNAQVPVRDAAEGERPLLHDPLRAARLDLRVPPDAQPLAYGRRRALRGAQGQPDRKRGRRELAQGRLLPPRPVQHSRTTRRRARRRSGTATRATRESPSAGSTSTTSRRTGSRST